MILHFIIISLQCAALAAFLILWYFYVRRRLEVSYRLEDEEQVLFPFRHFSWMLIGLVLVTSIAQIHFVRVSSQVHERMAVIAAQYKNQNNQSKMVEDLKGVIEKMRRDMEGNFKVLRTQLAERQVQAKNLHTVNDSHSSVDRSPDKEGLIRIDKPRVELGSNVFAREAKASSSAASSTRSERMRSDEETPTEEYSMRLNRNGKVVRDQVRVRKRPQLDSPPVEKLMTGQPVKVTEKRLDAEGKIWFRVVTPSGRAGWVDFRYVKLDGNA